MVTLDSLWGWSVSEVFTIIMNCSLLNLAGVLCLTLVTVPEADHWVQQNAPELVTRTMVNWLKRQDTV
jgi:hypothetical protein